MANKVKKSKDKLKDIVIELNYSHEHWKDINDNGCSDPFWADGMNMNLVRNHIIYYRKQIEDICAETGEAFPTEYYYPIPPIVDNNYMANLNQKERVKRLLQFGNDLTIKKTEFDNQQLCFA